MTHVNQDGTSLDPRNTAWLHHENMQNMQRTHKVKFGVVVRSPNALPRGAHNFPIEIHEYRHRGKKCMTHRQPMSCNLWAFLLATRVGIEPIEMTTLYLVQNRHTPQAYLAPFSHSTLSGKKQENKKKPCSSTLAIKNVPLRNNNTKYFLHFQ